MQSREQEKQNVIEWLAHPNELGCKPQKIEFTKEFTDDEGDLCMIFKYRKTLFSPWLLAIACDGGPFSEMQRYHPETEVADAKKLIEFLRQYWKNMANLVEEKQERAKKAGTFLAFVLLRELEWNFGAFEEAFDREWEITLDKSADGEGVDDNSGEAEAAGDSVRVYGIKQGESSLQLAISYHDFPVPNEEAEENAQFNYMWKDAVEVTKTHKAHLMVAVLGTGMGTPMEKGILYTKALTTMCRQANTIGVYANEVVYEPKFFIAASEMLQSGNLPLLNLVWFGLARSEKGVSAYTCGLQNFGKDEMEILDSDKQPSELRDFLLNTAGYVIEEDVILHDGETLGYTNEQRLKLVKSAGVNVQGESLKILF